MMTLRLIEVQMHQNQWLFSVYETNRNLLYQGFKSDCNNFVQENALPNISYTHGHMQ